ncbi:MAG: DUF4292 domain-containing protein [Mangrovibacterium sp.]
MRFSLLSLILLVVLSSCKSNKAISDAGKESVQMNWRRVLQEVSEQNYTYEGLEVGRLSCTVELGGKNVTAKGIIRAKHDEFIDLSVSKIIPLLRAHFTPDEVKVISYLQKGYYEGDYMLVADQFGFLVDFTFVQTVLTGSFHELKEGKLRPSTFNCYVENERYVLKRKQAKVFGDGLAFWQYMVINPKTYLVEALRLESVVDDVKLEVHYVNYQQVQGQQVPTEISLEGYSHNQEVKALLQWGKVELKEDVKNSFTIAEKYQKLN